VIATPLAGYLLVAALVFAIGLAGALTRRNAILVLIGIELMLNATNLLLVAFSKMHHLAASKTNSLTVVGTDGQLFVFVKIILVYLGHDIYIDGSGHNMTFEIIFDVFAKC